jgi:predicted nucleic acid-binding protein
MKIFLDSSAIIEFFKNNINVIELIANADELYTSVICEYEVLVGENYKKQKRINSQLEAVQKFFDRAATLPLTFEDSINASEVMARLLTKSKKVDDFDVLIAMQAVSKESLLLTKDKHFEILKNEINLLQVQII